MQNIYCMNVQKYVMSVLKNAKSIVTWSIVKDAQKYVGIAPSFVIQASQHSASKGAEFCSASLCDLSHGFL